MKPVHGSNTRVPIKWYRKACSRHLQLTVSWRCVPCCAVTVQIRNSLTGRHGYPFAQQPSFVRLLHRLHILLRRDNYPVLANPEVRHTGDAHSRPLRFCYWQVSSLPVSFFTTGVARSNFVLQILVHRHACVGIRRIQCSAGAVSMPSRVAPASSFPNSPPLSHANSCQRCQKRRFEAVSPWITSTGHPCTL